MDQIQVIVLAAGKGVRMQSENPKALTPFKGKAFLVHILDTLNQLNLTLKPVIVVGHKKEQIMEALGSNNIYAHQAEQLGTGHAVLSAKNSMDPKHTTIVVISADQPLVSKETLERLIKTHEDKKSVITLATATLPDFNEWRAGISHFGRVVRDEHNMLKNIVEYKDATDAQKEITEVNPAIYAFNAEWLWHHIDKIQNENSQHEYYITDLIKIAFEEGAQIETVPLENVLEVLQPNSKEELEILESLTV